MQASVARSGACNLTTKACSTVVTANPALTSMLTSIVYRGGALWGAHHALIPGVADVDPLPLVP